VPLPTLTKTYTHSANNRVVYASLTQTAQDVLFAWKAELKLRGFTVKGSSDSSAAAMDGLDRWATAANIVRGANTTSAQSWIVLEHAGMAGTEILLAYQGATDDVAKVSFSQGGIWTIAGTATFQPTAADECIVHASSDSLIVATTSLDRLWTSAVATDGSGLFFAIARGGVFGRLIYIGLATSAVLAPATWDVPAWGFSTTGTVFTHAAAFSGTTIANARISGADVNLNWGIETWGAMVCPNNTITGVWAWQGNEHVFQPCSLGSTTLGKAGNVIDIFNGPTNMVDGDTWPNDGTQTLVAVGDFVIPWNGTMPILS
jgi:hypothetical protein